MGVPGTTEATSTGTNITTDFSKFGLGNPDSMLGLNVPAGDAVIGADIAKPSSFASVPGTTGNLTNYQALAQDVSGVQLSLEYFKLFKIKQLKLFQIQYKH
jgi:hypothetical protein